MCYWSSSEGEFYFEDLAQEAIGLTTQPKNMRTMKWVIPDFTPQTKLTLRNHQGSRSQNNWHGSMNPLVSEMLDASDLRSKIYRRGSMNPLISEMLHAFRVLDPSDGA